MQDVGGHDSRDAARGPGEVDELQTGTEAGDRPTMTEFDHDLGVGMERDGARAV
jgi:hypothetical protein